VHDPVDRLHTRRVGAEAGGGEEADGEIGARALEAQRVEVPLIEARAGVVQLAQAHTPGLGRVGLVEP